MGVPYKQFVATSFATSFVAGRGILTLPWPLRFGYFGTFVLAFFLQFFAWAVYYNVLYPRFFSPLRHLPNVGNNHFFMGQWNRIREEPSGHPHREWARTVPNDGIIRYLGLLNAERLLLTSPKALSEVLTTRSYDFKKPSQVVNGIGRLLGIGILLAEGDEHRHQRKNLMPAFAFRHVKELFPVFWSKTSEAVLAMSAEIDALAGQGPVQAALDAGVPADVKLHPDEAIMEVGEWASRATLDIIGVAGMGQDFGAIADPSTPLYQTYRTIFRPSRAAAVAQLITTLLPRIIATNLPLKRNGEIEEAAKLIRDVARKLIRQKKDRLVKGEAGDYDILSVALESGGFTEDNLVDQLMTFLAAGHETTASAMTWAIYMLCLNPDVQTKLRSEIRANLPSPDDDTPVSAAQIEHLPYLNAVCAEVLRYYPSVPLTLREAAVDTEIIGQRIPKGTLVYVVPWATNRDPSLWGPDADVFDPERWLRDATGGAKSNYAHLTFIHGPRSCIGERFARGEFACLLAGFVGRMEFGLADGRLMDEKNLSIKGGVTAKPSKGLWTKVRRVEGW